MTSDALLLRSLFDAGCARMDAAKLVRSAVRKMPEGAGVVAIGKLAHRMALSAMATRPDFVPVASIGATDGKAPWMTAGDHPIPGTRSFAAGRWMLSQVGRVNGRPLVLLVSGGGSALLEAPLSGLTNDDLVETTARLLSARMPIHDVNAVRKRLSAIKGGKLAAAAPESDWHVFILSDVVGDDPSVVASGPCVPDRTPPHRARRACMDAGVWDRLPPRVRQRLSDGEPPLSLATKHVETRVLAGARELGLAVSLSSDVPATVLAPVEDPVEELADRYVRWAQERAGLGPALLVATGEPVLEVRGKGRGGRAQHLALLMAQRLSGKKATFLAAGSDGRDGPTEHAGAIVDGATAARAGQALADAVSRFDSASFHADFATAIERFEPVTHLGEVHLLLIR